MEPFDAIGNYYLINHLTLITGLSDRTIRHYIASNILQGEKINGLWHFTEQEVDAFLHHPAVMPSIQAKQNGIVYDFLIDRKKTEDDACIILDLLNRDPKSTAEFFFYKITQGDYRNIRCAFEHTTGVPRVILRGDPRDTIKILTDYLTK